MCLKLIFKNVSNSVTYIIFNDYLDFMFQYFTFERFLIKFLHVFERNTFIKMKTKERSYKNRIS